jgi:hypothetical protein
MSLVEIPYYEFERLHEEQTLLEKFRKVLTELESEYNAFPRYFKDWPNGGPSAASFYKMGLGYAIASFKEVEVNNETEQDREPV